MLLLLLLFFMIVAFALLTVYEIWQLKKWGFDILGHLKLEYDAGRSKRFFFEAFGVVAFVLAQPVIFIGVLVLAYNNIDPVRFTQTLRVILPKM